jgi:hypothetical protein
VAVLNNVELALAEGVPQLDSAVTRSRDDLTVVGGEGDASQRISTWPKAKQKNDLREDIAGVADELAGSQACVEVPEAEGFVPRGRKGELAVRGDDDVRDEVVVAVEDLLGETKVAVLARELPDNDGLVLEWISS